MGRLDEAAKTPVPESPLRDGNGRRAEFTLPGLLLRNAARYGSHRAMREKDCGIWQTYTWAQYLDNVRAFAMGLARLGVARDDKLAIVGDNRPELYWALLAAQSLGAMPVPLYQDAVATEMEYVINHSESTVVVAEDQEQVDKILEIIPRVPRLRHVIYEDPKGLRQYADPRLLSLSRVLELGREAGPQHRAAWDEEVQKGSPDEIAIINYTSGTTGAPKGVMLSHRALIATGESFLRVVPVDARDEMIAYLPMAWVGDTFFSVVVSLLTGAAINCPESTATVRQDFRAIGPTLTFAPPRIWENLLSQAQVKIEDADRLKRALARFLIARAMRVAKLTLEGKAVPLADRVVHAAGQPLMFGPLRDQLGLRRIRVAITGGAPIAPEMLQFFRGIGVNLKQLYGMTECSTPATVQPDGQVKLDSVGPPIPGVRVRIDESGEVLIDSPGLFSGYYRDPRTTAEALHDGWLRTSDAGFLDPDGHLVIVDRAKDVSRLQDGTTFAPQYIENKLKFSPYIKEAVAVGRERPYVAAILNVDADVVGNWAQKRGILYAGYTDLAQNAEVYAHLAVEVEGVNQMLASPLRVKRFVVLHKELDPDDAEITRTRKLRRGFIMERYAPIIDALYDPRTAEVAVRATVTYEDGRRSEVERVLRIQTLF